jgi:hypothetical protein
MFSKRTLPIVAAVLLSAFGAVARSPSLQTGSDLDAAGSGNPDSLEYSHRAVSSHHPSNDEINAAETGNPDSVNSGNQMPAISNDWAKRWEAQELGNPDFR